MSLEQMLNNAAVPGQTDAQIADTLATIGATLKGNGGQWRNDAGRSRLGAI